jgi:hypothetical protein
VIAAIREIKARGLRVTLAPVLMLDIPASNARINPSTGAAPQPAYAAATRITASLAPGVPGSPDLTAAMTSEITTLFGAATPAHFVVSGDTVRWIGPASDRGLRRFVLHYAHLAARARGGQFLPAALDGLVTFRRGPAASGNCAMDQRRRPCDRSLIRQRRSACCWPRDLAQPSSARTKGDFRSIRSGRCQCRFHWGGGLLAAGRLA